MSDFIEQKEMRPVVRRALQLMNQYGLQELEYENKDREQTLHLTRSSSESFPPLLEGRSAEVTGKLRAPSVGRLIWEVEDGEEVSKGDRLGTIEKSDDDIEITSPASGIVTDPVEEGFVSYGDHLGSVVSTGEREEVLAQAENNDEKAKEEDE